MPIVPTKDILDRAFAERYGVAAINVINDLTMEAVLAAAEELKAPVILQTSVKHVKMTGLDAMYAMWVAYARRVSRPRRPAPGPLPGAGRDHRLPRQGLELGPLRCEQAVRGGEQAPVHRGRRRGPPPWRPRRGRDRGLQADRGDDRRRGRARPDARDRRRLREGDRGRRLRAGHRQRPRHVQDHAPPRLAAGHRHRRGDRDPGRAPRRHRHDARSSSAT